MPVEAAAGGGPLADGPKAAAPTATPAPPIAAAVAAAIHARLLRSVNPISRGLLRRWPKCAQPCQRCPSRPGNPATMQSSCRLRGGRVEGGTRLRARRGGRGPVAGGPLQGRVVPLQGEGGRGPRAGGRGRRAATGGRWATGGGWRAVGDGRRLAGGGRRAADGARWTAGGAGG